jgi:hypothetical protein
MFETTKLRRGVPMFRATRSSADNRQVTTILQQVLSSERRSTTNAERAADRKLARARRRRLVYRSVAPKNPASRARVERTGWRRIHELGAEQDYLDAIASYTRRERRIARKILRIAECRKLE